MRSSTRAAQIIHPSHIKLRGNWWKLKLHHLLLAGPVLGAGLYGQWKREDLHKDHVLWGYQTRFSLIAIGLFALGWRGAHILGALKARPRVQQFMIEQVKWTGDERVCEVWCSQGNAYISCLVAKMMHLGGRVGRVIALDATKLEATVTKNVMANGLESHVTFETIERSDFSFLDRAGVGGNTQDVIFCNSPRIFFQDHHTPEMLMHICGSIKPGGMLLVWEFREHSEQVQQILEKCGGRVENLGEFQVPAKTVVLKYVKDGMYIPPSGVPRQTDAGLRVNLPYRGKGGM